MSNFVNKCRALDTKRQTVLHKRHNQIFETSKVEPKVHQNVTENKYC